MTRRGLQALLVLVVLTLGDLDVVWGQTPPPAVQGLDQLSPEERALAERNLERWKRLTPEERQRALENYRHWKSMTPEEREAARQNYRRFRQLTPDQRAQVLRDFQHWNELPQERQQQLQQAYERWQAAPGHRSFASLAAEAGFGASSTFGIDSRIRMCSRTGMRL